MSQLEVGYCASTPLLLLSEASLAHVREYVERIRISRIFLFIESPLLNTGNIWPGLVDNPLLEHLVRHWIIDPLELLIVLKEADRL